MEEKDENKNSASGGKKGILYRLVLKICFGNKRIAEILRFCIVGGVATVVDFLVMGITLYIFNPSLYPNFFNVFYGGGTPTVLASCVGTGAGFIAGLIVNYVLSVLFVFDEKGNSKTFSGFVVFALLSAGGLAINVLGMYLFVDLAHWNEWLIKIMLTLVVLVYNYLTRKLIIFRKRGNDAATAAIAAYESAEERMDDDNAGNGNNADSGENTDNADNDNADNADSGNSDKAN